ncbi:rhomboid family intramembrane serine protease [Kiloniella laminariae]|uniref:Rhomboid family intramembrane serine protease n=1 Tax=Kiloniella laminariae TaxID=454162 RepID=A0ABT4LLC6_9PROT|nr:rhomboid family intramembrane serine protease [Kiloniella laminariae]MCZ4280767.1 rhomboid family intramembrane serine protease [Kiloniella laminariae]
MLERLLRLKDVIIFAGIMWIAHFTNWMLDGKFWSYGVAPRSVDHLSGIVFSPFIHGDYIHLISNTVPLLIFGGLISQEAKWRFWQVSVTLIFLSGGLLWLVGFDGIHFGASGVVFGLFSYLLGRAWWRRDFLSILAAVIVLALYSGLISSLFVIKEGISWEGHLVGFLAGGIVAYVVTRFQRPAIKQV